MSDNLIIDEKTEVGRKSISMDTILFELFSALKIGTISRKEDRDQIARLKIKGLIRLWCREKKLSRKIQHYVLSQVARPNVAEWVFDSDSFRQEDLI